MCSVNIVLQTFKGFSVKSEEQYERHLLVCNVSPWEVIKTGRASLASNVHTTLTQPNKQTESTKEEHALPKHFHDIVIDK